MRNIPPDVLKRIQEEMCRPEGTVSYSQRERANFTADDLKEEAVARNRTVLQKMVGDRRINFQDYEEAKKAYRKAYGIKFGE